MYISNNTNKIRNSKLKKKILIIGPSPNAVGGIATFVEGLINSELSLHYNFEILDILKSKKRDNLIKREQSVVKDLLGSSILLIEFITKLINTRYDIIHINSSAYLSFYEKLMLLLISNLFRRKTVFHIHSGSFPVFYAKVRYKSIVSRILNKSSKVICVSSSIQECLRLTNTVVIPNGINIPHDFKKQYNKNSTTFISICLLEKNKNLDVVIKAVEILKKQKIMNFKYLIAGAGGEKEHLEQLVEELNLTDRIIFAGVVIDKQKIEMYRNAEVYISVSDYESFGISLAEAMSYKLAIISTPTGIAIDRIIDGKNGYLISSQDANELAEKMKAMIYREIDLFEAGIINQTIIDENYSWGKISAQFADVYESL